MPKLRSLELWEGKALAQNAEVLSSLINNNCQDFEGLSLYQWYIALRRLLVRC